ncbi:MAG: hypothetical protein K0Q57_1219, partial [Gammaproteobacteria bacterium]|nr:hypothetical protein [Gammaproteobacteria bacterium]
MNSLDWDKMEQDLSTAQDIIACHYEDPEETVVGIQEVTYVPEGSIQISRADWVIEFEETMEAKYGEKEGCEMARKVMTVLITQGELI